MKDRQQSAEEDDWEDDWGDDWGYYDSSFVDEGLVIGVWSVLYFEDKAEGEGSFDEACVGDEGKFLFCCGIFLAKSECTVGHQDWNDSAKNDDETHNDYKTERPFILEFSFVIFLIKSKRTQTDIRVNHTFSRRSKNWYRQTRNIPSLRRQIIPCVMRHHYSTDQEAYYRRKLIRLWSQVSHHSCDDKYTRLCYFWYTQEPQVLEDEAAERSTKETYESWEGT